MKAQLWILGICLSLSHLQAQSLLQDINHTSTEASSIIGEAARFGNGLFFTANSLEYGGDLWFTDGTETGTQLILDAVPGRVNGSFRYGYDYDLRHVTWQNTFYF